MVDRILWTHCSFDEGLFALAQNVCSSSALADGVATYYGVPFKDLAVVGGIPTKCAALYAAANR